MNKNVYCKPDCQWLSPTEEEQEQQSIKAQHRCGKFNKTLYHLGAHPNIYRYYLCEEQ